MQRCGVARRSRCAILGGTLRAIHAASPATLHAAPLLLLTCSALLLAPASAVAKKPKPAPKAARQAQSAPAHTSAQPGARELVVKYLEAIGGEAARRVESRLAAGTANTSNATNVSCVTALTATKSPNNHTNAAPHDKNEGAKHWLRGKRCNHLALSPYQP